MTESSQDTKSTAAKKPGLLIETANPVLRFYDAREFGRPVGAPLIKQEMCQQFIDAWDEEHAQEGKLSQDGSYDGDLDHERRKSKHIWLDPTDENLTEFTGGLMQILYGLNQSHYGFLLDGMTEFYQLTKYEGDGGHFGWHTDIGTLHSRGRKLTFSIQLSDPDTYEGGDLEVMFTNEMMTREQGHITVFPSFSPHRVHPVTSGTRFALVGWLSGPDWR